MENQHREIKGYRALNEGEIALMNKVKTKGAELGDLIAELRATPGLDARWISIGAVARTLFTAFTPATNPWTAASS